MADNKQQWGNFIGGQTSKAKEATVIPASKNHMSTMMAERVVKVVQSTAKIYCQAKLYLKGELLFQNKGRSMADNRQQWGNFTGGQASKAKEATVIPTSKKHVSTMMAERVGRSMADNRQQWGNFTGGQTSKANEATVIPASKKHVSTMMAERVVKVVQSTAKSIKNKNKINPA
ncbi:hypothetical protein OSB04_029134 [Centaurea solstitialis]|uniref:Uncharacterized protein n=1 Tax=Centaurea solstitialis TaxID=347529 RepID=A0AA38SPK2_9ASTR|nr:hypothetical protein OSB04_029134 [Centaurea solstitialis]